MLVAFSKSGFKERLHSLRRLIRDFSNPITDAASRSFGIAFDIDGVLLRGEKPVGGSPQALQRLFHPSGKLAIPFIFLTNGGGVPESERAKELGDRLGVHLLPSQIVQGHSPFRQLSNRYENELVVAVGKGKPAEVLSEYGFKKVLSIDEYSSYFDGIDPLAPYKCWKTNTHAKKATEAIKSERVKAAFVVSDSVDWSRDIQVLCDILRTGGFPGREMGTQPDLFFANDDVAYQATFPAERLGMGAFRIALESVFNTISTNPLVYTSFGKPNRNVFKNAEGVLNELSSQCVGDVNSATRRFDTLYMVGDNPSVDIKGAKLAGKPWYSILTRTGVFKAKGNHSQFPADIVVDSVEDAVERIFERESMY